MPGNTLKTSIQSKQALYGPVASLLLCYVMLCYVMLCYVMLCYVMLCCVMLCYAWTVQVAMNAFYKPLVSV